MKTIEKRRKKHARLTYQTKSLPLSARVWVHSTYLSSFQQSNWSPTYILHLFHLEDTSLLFIFLSESVKVYFLPCIDTFSFAQEPRCLLFLNKCACSRRVHIEGHMNRFEFLLSWTIIPITIVLGLSCQKIISFAA